METTSTRPTTEQEREALEFLNFLRKTGVTNMFGAGPYVEEEFGIDRREARRLVSLWMRNFNEEGKYDTVEE